MGTISSQTCAAQITSGKQTKIEKNAEWSDPVKKRGFVQ